MTARTRKPSAVATTSAAAAPADVCVVPDCVPGLHGAVVDGLCPVHRQTHPGLARREHTEQPDPAVVAAEREAADREQREGQAAAEQHAGGDQEGGTGE